MTINRIKPADWSNGDSLDRHLLTNLDRNVSFLLDKRLGFPDQIKSELTFDGYSKLSIMPTAKLYLTPSPTEIEGVGWNINIRPNHVADPLRLDCEINGTNNDPLRLGFCSIDMSGSAAYSSYLSNTQYKKFHIQLKNYNDTSFAIPRMFFPSAYDGYYYMMVELTADSTQDVLLTYAAHNWITLTPGKVIILYNNKYDVYEIANNINDSLIESKSFFNYNLGTSYTSKTGLTKVDQAEVTYLGIIDGYSTIHNLSNVNTSVNYTEISATKTTLVEDSYPLFSSVKQDDIFEIQLGLTLNYKFNYIYPAENRIYICPYVAYGTSYTVNQNDRTISILNPQSSILLYDSIFATTELDTTANKKFFFKAPMDGVYQFKLYLHGYAGRYGVKDCIMIAAPIVLNINQYRF